MAGDVERVPEDDIPEGWRLRERGMERDFESVRQILRGESVRPTRREENNNTEGNTGGNTGGCLWAMFFMWSRGFR